MLENQQNPFVLWKLHSDEELRELDLSGAKIELAARTKDEEDIKAAIASLDDNSFNAIFILTLAENDEQLKDLLFKLDTHLTPLLTDQRNLKVEENDKLFKYLAHRVLGKITGPLNVLAGYLQSIEKRTLTTQSSILKKMITLGYSRSDTLYLNYAWVKQKVGDSSRIKLLALLISEYFDSDVELTEVQKNFIKRELQSRPKYPSSDNEVMGDRIVEYCYVSAKNYNNWLFAKQLTEEGILPEHNRFIFSIPFLQSDEQRFTELTKIEQFYSLDYSLEGIKTKQALYDLLEKFDCMDYLNLQGRKISYETLVQLIRLGVVSYNDLNPKVIGNIMNSKALNSSVINYLMSPDCNVKVKELVNFSYSGNNIKTLFSPNISKEEQRKFISFVIQEMYDTCNDRAFVNFIIQLLNYKDLAKYYDKSLLLEISNFVVNNFPECFSWYCKADDTLKLYMEPADFQKYLKDKEMEVERRRKLAEENRIRAFTEKVDNSLLNIDNGSDLFDYYNKTGCRYDEESILLNKTFSKMLSLLKEEETLNPETINGYLKLCYTFFNKTIIGLDTYLSCVAHILSIYNQEG